MIKINCIDNDRGAWCKNTEIPRSLFGIGARTCIEFCDSKKCSIKTEHKRPPPPPAPPKPTQKEAHHGY